MMPFLSIRSHCPAFGIPGTGRDAVNAFVFEFFFFPFDPDWQRCDDRGMSHFRSIIFGFLLYLPGGFSHQRRTHYGKGSPKDYIRRNAATWQSPPLCSQTTSSLGTVQDMVQFEAVTVHDSISVKEKQGCRRVFPLLTVSPILFYSPLPTLVEHHARQSLTGIT